MKLYLQINHFLSINMLAKNENNPSEVVELLNPCERPAFILLCEHAANFIPAEFNDLGVDEATLNSHAAYDLGALALAKLLTKKLNAPLIAQKVSRLLYDCNRPPSEASAMPVKSEIYEISGNVGLTQTQRNERTERFYEPFHNLCETVIQHELDDDNQAIIVTIHSFTRHYFGKDRNTEIGILHDDDHRFADAMLELAANDDQFKFERNEPYGPQDGVTHSLKEYAQPHGLHNVMIEVRNDLLADAQQQNNVAEKLATYLLAAHDILRGK